MTCYGTRIGNMPQTPLIAKLPADVARELIESGMAAPTPVTRSPVLADIVLTGLPVLTSTITLAQGPAAIADIAHRLTNWRRRTAVTHNPMLSVNATGPRGHVSLELTGDTTEEQIAQTVSLVLDHMPDQASASDAKQK
jgi:hypothetical protein